MLEDRTHIVFAVAATMVEYVSVGQGVHVPEPVVLLNVPAMQGVRRARLVIRGEVARGTALAARARVVERSCQREHAAFERFRARLAHRAVVARVAELADRADRAKEARTRVGAREVVQILNARRHARRAHLERLTRKGNTRPQHWGWP